MLRRFRIVLPLGPGRVAVIVVIADVLDHRDAVAVALADEMLILVAVAGARLDAEVVRVAIPPAVGAGELGHGEQFDGIDAEVAQVRQQIQGVLQVAGALFAGPERVDVQLVDDQVLDPAGDRRARRELACPELGLGNPVAAGAGEVLGNGFQAPDEATALGPVELGRVAGAVPAARVVAAAADLVAREEVRPEDRLPLSVPDAVHVRGALEGGEVGEDLALPDPAGLRGEGQHRAGRVEAIAVIGDVAALAPAEDYLDFLSVGCPDGEPQARRRRAGREVLPRPQAAGVGEVEILLLGISLKELELPVALRGVHVVDLGRDAPEVGARGTIEPDAPAKPLPDLALVKLDPRGEARAAVFGRAGRHGRIAPGL